MLITIQRGAGATRVIKILSGLTRDFSPPSNYVETPSSIDQIATGLRWREAVPYDRGNDTTVIDWDQVQRHASTAAAEKFIATLKAGLAGEWEVYIREGDGKGGVRWLKSALVRPAQLGYLSVQSTVHYRITGGRMRESLTDTE
jgi:hypothetical protein